MHSSHPCAPAEPPATTRVPYARRRSFRSRSRPRTRSRPHPNGGKTFRFDSICEIIIAISFGHKGHSGCVINCALGSANITEYVVKCVITSAQYVYIQRLGPGNHYAHPRAAWRGGGREDYDKINVCWLCVRVCVCVCACVEEELPICANKKKSFTLIGNLFALSLPA